MSSVSKCQSRAADRKCQGRPEEGPVPAEEPPVPHLEGSKGSERRCGFTRSSESAPSRVTDLPSSTEVGAHLPQLGTGRPLGPEGQGQRLEFDKRNSSKTNLLVLAGLAGGRGRALCVALSGWNG